jgi:hypothetical protein
LPVSINRTENGDPPSEFEDTDIAEEELIDAYVRNQLSADERKLIEKGLRTSPYLVNRLHFARLLADEADRAAEDEIFSYPEPKEPSRKKWWQFGLPWERQLAFNSVFAACALILVVGGAGLLAGWTRLRRESQQLAEQQAQLRRQTLELQKSAAEQRLATDQIRAQLREEQQRHEADQQLIAELQQAQNQIKTPSAATVATLFLLPTSRASENEKELKPPAGTSRIRLQLAVDSIDYPGFLVHVKNSQDKEIFQSKIRPPSSGKLVTITIPSKLLPAGAYSLQLSGISPETTSELIGNYSFRIAVTQK